MNITERAAKVLQEIDAALAMAEAVTPGPWNTQTRSYQVQTNWGGIGRYVAEMLTDTSHERDTDAAFIAASRTGWPTALRCLKTAIEGLLSLSDRMCDNDCRGGLPDTSNIELTTLCEQWRAAQ